MNNFNELPQEIIHEIFEYVPEYGLQVSKELHKRSFESLPSYYCDIIRYMNIMSIE